MSKRLQRNPSHDPEVARMNREWRKYGKVDMSEKAPLTPRIMSKRSIRLLSRMGQIYLAIAALPFVFVAVAGLAMLTHGHTLLPHAPYNRSEPVQTCHAGTYGMREDGTPKGCGWYGELKRPDGSISTEISVESDGLFMPLLAPGLTQDQIAYLLNTPVDSLDLHHGIGAAILANAIDSARSLHAVGHSAFAD